jgi:type IX secretion system PorP/SprF family membrane protein
MKRYFLIHLFLGVYLFVFAQQDPQYSQVMFNQMAINPGYSGSNDMICVTALNRQQWIGFEGAPSTTIFNVNAPFKLFNINSGAGLGIQKDKAGFDDNLSLSLAYAYRMEVGTGKLGIGLGMGFFNKTLEPEWVIPSSDYHVQPGGDPLIPENNESYIALDIGFGIYYRTDELYLGISTTHLNEAKIKYSKSTPYLKRHYYLIAGYHLPINNPLFEVTPCLFMYSDGKISQLSINTNVLYNKKFWGGVTYRAGNAIVGMVGMELFNGVRIGYAYDFATSDIRKNSKGSHEFMLSYCFSLSLDRSPQRYKSVRFL